MNTKEKFEITFYWQTAYCLVFLPSVSPEDTRSHAHKVGVLVSSLKENVISEETLAKITEIKSAVGALTDTQKDTFLNALEPLVMSALSVIPYPESQTAMDVFIAEMDSLFADAGEACGNCQACANKKQQMKDMN